MAFSLNFQPRKPKSFHGFREFIFIGNSSEKITKNRRQLHVSPDNSLLNQTDTGSSLLIEQIFAAKNIARQLKNLHFQPGKQVRLVNKTKNGSVVVSCDDKLIGMGSEIAEKIIVTSAS